MDDVALSRLILEHVWSADNLSTKEVVGRLHA
jgi:hypothetical protein